MIDKCLKMNNLEFEQYKFRPIGKLFVTSKGACSFKKG